MTETESAVWSMSAKDLLAAARVLAHRAADLEADLLVHLGEIDERKLYLECSYPSMFTYCVSELGFSEDAAYNRIHVARAGRRFPAILEAIRDGRVHLWGMRLLIPHLTESNHLALIAAAAERTKRDIEQLIADLAPRAPVATVIRSIPATAEPPQAAIATLAVDRDGALAGAGADPSFAALSHETQPAPPPPPRAGPPIVPLSAQTYKIQFTAGRAFRDKLVEAKDLMRHRVPDGNLESILGAALELLVEQVKKERFGVGRKPRSGPADGANAGGPGSESASRHIPDWIKRMVYERDGGRCTFVDARGRRCPATGALEFEHDDGFARTGRHDPDRIRLLCRAHNQYAADKMYGRSFMDSARRKGTQLDEAGVEEDQRAQALTEELIPVVAGDGIGIQRETAPPQESPADTPLAGGGEAVPISETPKEEPILQERPLEEWSGGELPGPDAVATCSGTSPPPLSP
jgi:hypothetical protein